ncbi:MAG: hypothetical protein FJY67_11930, partial [Calditrichaeota bacterium]|nr:hypothetical protein [Calditrichota bacterium]
MSVATFAQPAMDWARIYPSNNRPHLYANCFYDLYRTRDGNLALSGYYNTGELSLWMLLVDEAGDPLHELVIHESNRFQTLHSLIEADNGDLVAAGFDDGVNEGDGVIVRVSAELEPIWRIYYGGQRKQKFHAIIELKDGNFLAAGVNLSNDMFQGDAYLVKITGNGDIVWQRTYGAAGRHDSFWALRECAEAYLLAGSANWRGWLLMVDERGEPIWSQTYTLGGEGTYSESFGALTSVPEGGFLAVGFHNTAVNMEGVTYAARVAADGEVIWQSGLEGELERGGRFAFDVVSSSDGGFVIAGYQPSGGHILRIGDGGNLQWTVVIPIQGGEFESSMMRSVRIDERGAILAAGQGSEADGAGGGILAKFQPERSAPLIVEYSPVDLEFFVLLESDIAYHIRAEDAQGDEIFYYYTLRGDTIAREADFVVALDIIGDAEIVGIASDGDMFDSVRWLVHVRDLFITSHTPDTLSLTLRRNSEINFSLDSVAYIGDLENLRYEWLIYDSTAVRWEEVGGDDRIGIRSYAFDRTGGYALKAKVFDPNVDPMPADSVQWAIQVRGVIRAYEPNTPEISLEPRQETTFELIPFNANNDSIEFWWTLNEPEDTLSTQSILSISFEDTGRYVVSGYARERVGEDEWEEDVQRWVVNVGMLSVDDFGLDSGFRRNDDPLNISIAPNPFNDQATVTIDLGGRAFLPALRADKNVRPPSAQVGGL